MPCWAVSPKICWPMLRETSSPSRPGEVSTVILRIDRSLELFACALEHALHRAKEWPSTTLHLITAHRSVERATTATVRGSSRGVVATSGQQCKTKQAEASGAYKDVDKGCALEGTLQRRRSWE